MTPDARQAEAYETPVAGRYGTILADPPWHFAVWGEGSKRNVTSKYSTMTLEEMTKLPVADWAADDCALFMWVVWPRLFEALPLIDAWGFTYKTCALCWVKGEGLPLFPEDIKTQVGMGYWTRANTEVCLLATRGRPKRLNADVRQVIIDRRREHSRKPDEVYERIERLVDGPYLEMFARQPWPGWTAWGNETSKFTEAAE